MGCLVLAIAGLAASCVVEPPSGPKAGSGIGRKILVHGHRGARAERPENTLAGLRHALEVGADVLEMDVHATKDNQLVLSHDPHVPPSLCVFRDGRPVPRGLSIKGLLLSQVATLDCGRLKHPGFPRQVPAPGEGMPTLDAVLSLVANHPQAVKRHVELNIELKSVPGAPDLYPPPRALARLLAKALVRHRMAARTIVQSFDYRTLEAMRSALPEIRISLLTGKSFTDFAHLARRYKPDTISPNHRWIRRKDVQRLHAMGVKVVPWTANGTKAWARLVGLRVDGIITDDPRGLVEYLKKRGLRKIL